MSKTSLQTKTFIVLFVVAVFGAFLSINLSFNFLGTGPSFQKDQKKNITPDTADQSTVSLVDTSSWKIYTDNEHGFSFKYNPDWNILPVIKKGGYEILQIDPGAKYYNVKIYISPQGYFAMDGLPIKNTTIGGRPAQDVSDMLYGVFNNSNYYTFDMGLSTSLKNDFNGLVHSVTFAN